MAKGKKKSKPWEIDVDQVTLNDFILIEEGTAAFARGDFGVSRAIRDLLGRLVKNKTAEEIGTVPFGELWEHLDAIGEAIQDVVPKPNDTPS